MSLGLFAFATLASAQNSFTNLAGEYAVIGTLPGDQVSSHVALRASGGWIVWQDNATDGFGTGISARRLGSSLSGDFSAFRVNQIGVGEQENPQAALLNDGGVAFVWQGGAIGRQDIYARILNSNGVFTTGDVLVNSHTNQQQALPTVAALKDGNLAVAWSSYGQDGSLQGVYAKVLSPAGVPLTGDLQVNQTTQLNQRGPAIAALNNGNFVLVWASELYRSFASTNNAGSHVVSIMARVYGPAGAPVTGEFAVSALDTTGSQPSVAATASGGYLVSWGQLSPATASSWDVHVKAFDVNNTPLSGSVVVNAHTEGDQFAPKIASTGANALVVWTSLGQDGSSDGVFGRALTSSGNTVGGELRINTTTLGKQFLPTLAADESGRFLVAWSSFIGGATSVDLFAQRYVVEGADNGLYAPDAPYVSSLSATQLSVTWPELSGYPVAFYELHMAGVSSPIVVTGLQTVVENLSPATEYSFRLLYQLTDGTRSVLSASVQGRTWGGDLNGDGLPDDWQSSLWGANNSDWPAGLIDSDGDGASNTAEFWAGTDPTDAASVLKTRMQRTGGGMRFSWNTQPGFVYQVQRANNLTGWSNFGSQRFASGSFDLIQIDAGQGPAFYRVICLR